MDYVFTTSGRFSSARPAGWAWGPAELDPRQFTIIRTDDPTWKAELPALEANRRALAEAGQWLRDNIYSTGGLKDVPEKEWLCGQRWTLLRTGQDFDDEDTAWDAAEKGDIIFLVKSRDLATPGAAMLVLDKAGRRGALLSARCTREEASAWRS